MLFYVFAMALCVPGFLIAQEDESEGYIMLEDEYIMAKTGHEAQFEAAIKAHNEKYHSEAPYEAELYQVHTGNEAGWYIWEMGPTTYTQLDTRPQDEGHDSDWANTVAPHVAKYGRTEYWRLNNALSYSNGTENDKYIIWYVDIARGENYRFRAMMDKVKKVHEKMDDEISVWYSQFAQNDGRDACIVWGFDKWGEFDIEDWQISEEFDAEFGDGEWDNALEEWEEVVKSVIQEVWLTVD